MEAPALRVLVVEKRPHPVPEAAFKVGESSVEIGAHYFQKRLGLEPHLRAEQLEKLGLRYFFHARREPRHHASASSSGRRDFPPVPSFQLDRGRLENMLLRTNAELGVTVLDGCRVRIDRARRRSGPHRVSLSRTRRAATDHGALGRRRQRPGGAAQAAARARPPEHARRQRRMVARRARGSRSTTGRATRRGGRACRRACAGRAPYHLMGVGYWVWLIPLGSGSHSFGIVADGDIHPFCAHQPVRARAGLAARVRAAVRGSRRGACRRARGLSRPAALRARLRARLLAATAGRWSAKRACSPIRSTRRARISSRWATTTSPI